MKWQVWLAAIAVVSSQMVFSEATLARHRHGRKVNNTNTGLTDGTNNPNLSRPVPKTHDPLPMGGVYGPDTGGAHPELPHRVGGPGPQ